MAQAWEKKKLEAAREIIMQDKKRHTYATANDLKLIDLDGERVEDRSMGEGEEDLHTQQSREQPGGSGGWCCS